MDQQLLSHDIHFTHMPLYDYLDYVQAPVRTADLLPALYAAPSASPWRPPATTTTLFCHHCLQLAPYCLVACLLFANTPYHIHTRTPAAGTLLCAYHLLHVLPVFYFCHHARLGILCCITMLLPDCSATLPWVRLNTCALTFDWACTLLFVRGWLD